MRKGTGPEAEKAAVAQRAEARWQALIKGDIDAAYGFLSPASRQVTSVTQYKNSVKPGIWREAKVQTVQCEVEVCDVKVVVKYDFQNAKGIETPVDEKWILEGGTAYYVYRK